MENKIRNAGVKLGVQKGFLEKRLFEMPLSQMIDALSAIDELDQHLLVMLRESGDAAKLQEWEEKILNRRADREIFRNYRLRVEGWL